ncbi:hypothetical protein V6N12_021606 [Hibiscus sabdariffa]|uniref:Uncharacterized protein n=1 Tax=Hibiscus sabdariffa TaxID=183260 RepID=A0ABR2FSD3_9ROSI
MADVGFTGCLFIKGCVKDVTAEQKGRLSPVLSLSSKTFAMTGALAWQENVTCRLRYSICILYFFRPLHGLLYRWIEGSGASPALEDDIDETCIKLPMSRLGSSIRGRLCISQVEGFIELISHSAGLLLELSLGLECEMV